MFFTAPMQVTRIDENGNVSYTNDVEHEEGYTSIESMPKNVIQSPMDLSMNTPKMTHKDTMSFGAFVEVKQDIATMIAGLGIRR